MKQDKVRATRHSKRSAKRSVVVVAAALLLGSLSPASLSPAFATTHYEMNYRDIVRPNGQARSDAFYNPRWIFATAGSVYRETRRIPRPSKSA
jgi:hypothetical protein